MAGAATDKEYSSIGDLHRDIANAIRTQTGSTGAMSAAKFPENILSITTLTKGTMDADAEAQDIINNKTAYVNGKKVTGNLDKANLLDIQVDENNVFDKSTNNFYIEGAEIASIDNERRWIDNQTFADITIPMSILRDQNNVTADKIAQGQTILGVAGTYTSDANATTDKIVQGYSAYVNGEKIDGTIYDFYSAMVVPDEIITDEDDSFTFVYKPNQPISMTQQDAHLDIQVSSDQIAAGIDLKPESIAADQTVLGVQGNRKEVKTFGSIEETYDKITATTSNNNKSNVQNIVRCGGYIFLGSENISTSNTERIISVIPIGQVESLNTSLINIDGETVSDDGTAVSAPNIWSVDNETYVILANFDKDSSNNYLNYQGSGYSNKTGLWKIEAGKKLRLIHQFSPMPFVYNYTNHFITDKYQFITVPIIDTTETKTYEKTLIIAAAANDYAFSKIKTYTISTLEFANGRYCNAKQSIIAHGDDLLVVTNENKAVRLSLADLDSEFTVTDLGSTTSPFSGVSVYKIPNEFVRGQKNKGSITYTALSNLGINVSTNASINGATWSFWHNNKNYYIFYSSTAMEWTLRDDSDNKLLTFYPGGNTVSSYWVDEYLNKIVFTINSTSNIHVLSEVNGSFVYNAINATHYCVSTNYNMDFVPIEGGGIAWDNVNISYFTTDYINTTSINTSSYTAGNGTFRTPIIHRGGKYFSFIYKTIDGSISSPCTFTLVCSDDLTYWSSTNVTYSCELADILDAEITYWYANGLYYTSIGNNGDNTNNLENYVSSDGTAWSEDTTADQYKIIPIESANYRGLYFFSTAGYHSSSVATTTKLMLAEQMVTNISNINEVWLDQDNRTGFLISWESTDQTMFDIPIIKKKLYKLVDNKYWYKIETDSIPQPNLYDKQFTKCFNKIFTTAKGNVNEKIEYLDNNNNWIDTKLNKTSHITTLYNPIIKKDFLYTYGGTLGNIYDNALQLKATVNGVTDSVAIVNNSVDNESYVLFANTGTTKKFVLQSLEDNTKSYQMQADAPVVAAEGEQTIVCYSGNETIGYTNYVMLNNVDIIDSSSFVNNFFYTIDFENAKYCIDYCQGYYFVYHSDQRIYAYSEQDIVTAIKNSTSNSIQAYSAMEFYFGTSTIAKISQTMKINNTMYVQTIDNKVYELDLYGELGKLKLICDFGEEITRYFGDGYNKLFLNDKTSTDTIVVSEFTETEKDFYENVKEERYGQLTGSITNIQVTEVDGASYGFELNNDGYYESTNKGVSNSAAVAKITFTVTNMPVYIKVDYIQQSESGYDYGIIGKMDGAALSTSNTVDSSYTYSLKDKSSTAVQTYNFSDIVSVGTHSFYIKYRKDNSGDIGYDSLQFKVGFTIDTSDIIEFDNLQQPTVQVVKANYSYTPTTDTQKTYTSTDYQPFTVGPIAGYYYLPALDLIIKHTTTPSSSEPIVYFGLSNPKPIVKGKSYLAIPLNLEKE